MAVAVFFRVHHRLTDFYYFVYGGKTLLGTLPGATGNPLHLYAQHPNLQIGPNPLFFYAGISWMPNEFQQALWTGAIMGCALLTFAAVQRLHGGVASPTPWRYLLEAAVVIAAFRWVALFGHLDDAIALTGIAVATTSATTQRGWWRVAVPLGLAAGSKPWAVIAVPLLLALPPSQRRRAVVGCVALALAPWAPFVIADPHTVTALGSVHYTITAASGLIPLGFERGASAPGSLHTLELALGGLLGVLAVRRKSPAAVLLAAMMARVLLEPRPHIYYAAGPLIGAVLWDAAGRHRLPLWVAVISMAEVVLPYLTPEQVLAFAQPVLFLVAIAWLLRSAAGASSTTEQGERFASSVRMMSSQPSGSSNSAFQ